MRIVTYLGFTLLSIFVQFSVIDFIQGRLKIDEKPVDLKGTSQKRQLRDVLKDISNKRHALYYRTPKNKGIKNYSAAKLFSNTTLTELFATTDISTTVFDILYDENTTATEETYTTESLFTTNDFDNVTEITFFEKNNETTTKPDTVPKKTQAKDCNCNVMFGVCDINCCCDSDCLESEIELFPICAKNKSVIKEQYGDACSSHLPYFGYYGNSLFCIVKINLPERRTLDQYKIAQAPIDYFLSWKSNEKSQMLYEYTNNIYKYGDPIWLLKNGSIYHTDLPSPTVNNYCTGRKAIRFLKNEKYSCIVKISDLEMLQIAKSLENVTVISATPLSMNSSVLNCTSLHCVNWTINVCSNLVCTKYSKNKHEPTCTESDCTNLAHKIEYIFHYHNSKIINASIKFHLKNMTMDLPFISQEIQVKFVLTNESMNKIIQLSGNPGYLDGLPIIVSYAEKNYTETFYNTTVQTKIHLKLPDSKNGYCMSVNKSENLILFGINKRFKCRYYHKYLKLSNLTEECKNVQNNISHFLELNNKVFLVSPLGNPHQLKDKDWLSIEKSSFEGPLYGGVQEFQDKSSKFICYNLFTRYSIIFSFAHVNGNSKIVSCKYVKTAKNVTFTMEDISTVITIDISFIDVTKPSVIEYVTRPPSRNIHLPDDFFYPFRSNESRIKYNVFTMILYFITIISCK